MHGVRLEALPRVRNSRGVQTAENMAQNDDPELPRRADYLATPEAPSELLHVGLLQRPQHAGELTGDRLTGVPDLPVVAAAPEA
jgi:hypothetical protein